MKSEPSEGRGGGECDLLISVGEREWGMSGFLLTGGKGLWKPVITL